MNPNLNLPPNLQSPSALPELKRFLDRLLGLPAGDEMPLALQQEYQGAAIALGVIQGDSQDTATPLLPVAVLVERTRACIRLQEQPRPADQAMETMSAPPAMPDAVP